MGLSRTPSQTVGIYHGLRTPFNSDGNAGFRPPPPGRRQVRRGAACADAEHRALRPMRVHPPGGGPNFLAKVCRWPVLPSRISSVSRWSGVSGGGFVTTAPSRWTPTTVRPVRSGT